MTRSIGVILLVCFLALTGVALADQHPGCLIECPVGHPGDCRGGVLGVGEMKVTVYSIGTWDTDHQAYTPQDGLNVPCINVPLTQMRQALRELREFGYTAHRTRSTNGSYDNNDPSVLVERTDGMTDVEVLESWKR